MIGAGAPTTIIDGGGIGRVIHIDGCPGNESEQGINTAAQSNVISNFTIQNGRINWGCSGMPVGGGVYVTMGHIVTMNDCTIKNNVAEFLGGGIYNAGQMALNRCTVSGNSAGMVGGGIANFWDEPILDSDGTMSLTNCTIYGNNVFQAEPAGAAPEFAVSLALGGGVYNGGNASFLNVTIANNTISQITVDGNPAPEILSLPVPHGGGFANVPLQCEQDNGPIVHTPVATFKNTIVANNTPENGYSSGGIVISEGHNLDSENTCGFDQPTDLINTNPLLGPLQDNGGPTFTCALLEGSPAIDAGDDAGAPATDQRGVTRPQGAHVDIGAYEFVPVVTPEAGGPAQFNVSPSNPNNWTRNLNPPTMSVAFVSVNPQQAVADQPVTISTNVVNTGDQGGNMSVALKINGIVEQTRMVSVGPQASQPIKFTVTKAQPGTYAIDIGGQTGSFTIPDAQAANRLSINWTMIILLIMAVLAIAIVMVLMLNRRSA